MHYSSTLGWQTLYKQESFDAITRAGNGTHVEFVANGLIPGEPHRFRVAFCRNGSRKGCNCWSAHGFLDTDQNGSPDSQPTAFPSSPVAFPAGTTITQRLGEPFSSLPTKLRTASPPGDGWGSSTVWESNDSDVLSLDYNSDGTVDRLAHRLQQSSRASLARLALTPVSYTEAEFQPLCTVGPTPEPKPNPDTETDCLPDGTSDTPVVNYRVDIETQYSFIRDICFPTDPNAPNIPYEYWLQVVYEPNWGDGAVPVPSIRLARAGQATCPALPADYVRWLIGPGFVPVATLCSGADVTALKNGAPVFARLIRSVDSSLPALIVQLGWGGCTSSGCANTCTITQDQSGNPLVDDQIEDPMHPLMQSGKHALSSHHWDADFKVVRGGSQ